MLKEIEGLLALAGDLPREAELSVEKLLHVVEGTQLRYPQAFPFRRFRLILTRCFKTFAKYTQLHATEW